jgi:RNA polymerase sigma-32 factor
VEKVFAMSMAFKNRIPQQNRRSGGSRSRVALSAESLQPYLADIRNYPILTREEESDLATRYTTTHDADAAMRLVNCNLRLVVKIALEYQSSQLPLSDLIQEGNLGLLQAVRKFDPDRKIRLSSYAQWWIRAYILKFLMDNYKLVKLGTTQAQRKLFYNLKKEADRLLQEGLDPTHELLAERLQVREQDVSDMQTRLSNREVSLDAPISNHEDASALIEVIPALDPLSDTLYAQQEISSLIKKKFNTFRNTLAGRDVDIWEQRLVAEDPVTLQELGDRFGISRERARQLEARIMLNLSKYLTVELEGLDALEDTLAL